MSRGRLPRGQLTDYPKDEYAAKAKDATPDSASAGADQLASTVQDQPLPFAVGAAFALGLVIGWLLGRRQGG